MKRAVLIMMTVGLLFAAGCSTVGGNQPAPVAAASDTAPAPVAASQETTSIPTMEFVAASDVPSGSRKPGKVLAPGSYEAALSGEHIIAVEWDAPNPDVKRLDLNLTFDSFGAAAFAELTDNNVGKNLLVLLNGRVLASLSVNEPITGGEVSLGSDDVVAARRQIDSATVHTP